jgi:hypothetical protein
VKITNPPVVSTGTDPAGKVSPIVAGMDADAARTRSMIRM